MIFANFFKSWMEVPVGFEPTVIELQSIALPDLAKEPIHSRYLVYQTRRKNASYIYKYYKETHFLFKRKN